MCADRCKDIEALVEANWYDSKHNSNTCCILTNSGGNSNNKFNNPTIFNLLMIKVKKQPNNVKYLWEMQGKWKIFQKEMIKWWEDLLREATKDIYTWVWPQKETIIGHLCAIPMAASYSLATFDQQISLSWAMTKGNRSVFITSSSTKRTE